MNPEFGEVSGPEHGRLTEKLFGAAFVPRPIAGVSERMTVAEHLRLYAQAEKPLLSEATLWGDAPYLMDFAVYRAVNRLLAAGVEPKQLSLSVAAGVNAPESEFRRILQRARTAAERLLLPLADVELRRVPVTGYVMTAAAAGEPRKLPVAEKGAAEEPADGREGAFSYKIVMTGYAGVEGTLQLYWEREKELAERLPKHFRKGAEELWACLDAGEAIRLGWKHGAAAMMTYGDGGIFRGLWDLGERLRLGMEVSLPDILLRQQTIEACERFDINPYQMRGGGSVLMVTAEPKRLLSALWEAGVEAAEIGTLTAGAARILQNQEEQRYLEPFRSDSLAI